MSMRSSWKGSLGFGMVAIPVKLYKATEANNGKISLNQLHAECGGRVKMPKYCPKCDKQLETSEIVKGYEVSKDQYVQITAEDMENLPLKTQKAIQVEHFVRGLPDLRYPQDAYFLAPDKDMGAKAFTLFCKAMEAEGVIGIAKIAMRDREHLCAVRPYNGVLLLQTLHWASDLRSCDELQVSAEVTEKEMDMASTLIRAMTGEVDLADYTDDYTNALRNLIEAKMEGRVIEAPEVKEETKDLLDDLMKSVEMAQAAA